jgi:hypothetical protein
MIAPDYADGFIRGLRRWFYPQMTRITQISWDQEFKRIPGADHD